MDESNQTSTADDSEAVVAAARAGDEEKALLSRYVQAHERADLNLLASLLAEDVLQTMPPHPIWIDGRDSLLSFAREVFSLGSAMDHGRWRSVITRANRQPAVAQYVQRPSAELTAELAGE